MSKQDGPRVREASSEHTDLLGSRRFADTEMQHLALYGRLEIGTERRVRARRNVDGDEECDRRDGREQEGGAHFGTPYAERRQLCGGQQIDTGDAKRDA